MRRIFVILLAVLLFLPATGFAAPIDFSGKQVEYYTWNGFIPVRDAFTRISLIFGHNDFRALITVMAIAGLFLAGATAYMRLVMGIRAGVISWIAPVLAGMIIYMAFFVPKWKVYIYDPVQNRNAVVSDIPMGVAVAAGVLNLIERGFVDIIDASGATVTELNYSHNAGGIGVDVLLHAVKMGMVPDGTTGDDGYYLNKTVVSFIKDCVFMSIPLGHIDLNTMMANTTDFWSLWSNAKNPALYTVVYTPSDPRGTPETCSDAYNDINQKLSSNSVIFDRMLERLCKAVGIDTQNLQHCKNIVKDGLRMLDPNGNWAGTLTANGFMRQIYLANAVGEAAAEAAPSYFVGLTKGIESDSTWITMNRWIPVMKAAVTAITLSILPVFAVFIVTPIFGRALSLILGFMLWITMFGIMDAIIHQVCIDMGVNVLEQIGAKKLGFDAINFLDGPATKALAIFGYMRTTGMLFATIATGMLVKFGGYAVSSLAQGITGNIERAAVSAAERTMNPVTQMQTARGALETSALLWNGLQTAHDPRGWMRELAAAGAASSTISTMTTNATVGRYGVQELVRTNVINTGLSVGGARGAESMAIALGLDSVDKLAQWEKTGRFIDKDMAKRLQAQGFWGVREGMRIDNIAVDRFGNIKSLAVSVEDGSRSIEYKGGTVTVRTPYGIFSMDRYGNIISTSVPTKSAEHATTQRQSVVNTASERLTQQESFVYDVMTGKDLAQKYEVNERFAKELQSQAAQNAIRRIIDSKSYGKEISNETRQQLEAFMKAGVGTPSISPYKAEMGGGWIIAGTTKTGETVKVQLTGEEAKAFEEAYRFSLSHTLSKMMSTTEGVNEGQKIAKHLGLSDVAEKLRQVSDEKSASTTVKYDLMPYIVESMSNEILQNDKIGQYDKTSAVEEAVRRIRMMSDDEFNAYAQRVKEERFGGGLQEIDEVKNRVDERIGDAQKMKDEYDPLLKKVELKTGQVDGKGHIPKVPGGPNKRLFDAEFDYKRAFINAKEADMVPTNFPLPLYGVLRGGEELIRSKGFKNFVDQSVPYPFASEEEQRRRTDLMQDGVKRKIDENFKSNYKG